VGQHTWNVLECFTVNNGKITWGNTLGTFSNASVTKYSDNADAAVYSAIGQRVFTLQSKNTAWPDHLVNGDTTTNFQDFVNKLSIAGFSGASSIAIAPMPYNSALTSGLIAGHSDVDKFGSNPSITVASAPEEIWEFSEPYVWDADSTAPIQYISSSSTADIGQPIEISGLGIYGRPVTQIAVVNGQGLVVLDTALFRVSRMQNISRILDIQGTLYCHTDPTPSAGVPDDIAVRSIIIGRKNQTQNGFYTVPLGFVGKLHKATITIGLDGNAGAPVYQDMRVFPDIIPALTDLALLIDATTATVSATAAFNIELIEEDQFSTSFLEAIGQPGY